MSELKCPFCQDYLIPCIKNQSDWIYHCDNPKCPMYDDADIEDAKHPLASKDLWQELIRTRKALDVAVDALKDNLSQANFTQMLDASRFHCIRTKCELALEQITALEQKERK